MKDTAFYYRRLLGRLQRIEAHPCQQRFAPSEEQAIVVHAEEMVLAGEALVLSSCWRLLVVLRHRAQLVAAPHRANNKTANEKPGRGRQMQRCGMEVEVSR